MNRAVQLACIASFSVGVSCAAAQTTTTLLFTHDATKYLDRTTPPGLDGEEWRVYSTKPKRLLWKGYDGIMGKHPQLGYDYYVAQLENPRWNAQGELQATLTCSASKPPQPITVTLIQQGKKWSWQPAVNCPP